MTNNNINIYYTEDENILLDYVKNNPKKLKDKIQVKTVPINGEIEDSSNLHISSIIDTNSTILYANILNFGEYGGIFLVVSYIDNLTIQNEIASELASQNKTSIPQEDWGTHISHCCKRHGCKYGHNDCPVVLELTLQSQNQCYVGFELNQNCQSNDVLDFIEKVNFINEKYQEYKNDNNTDIDVYREIFSEFNSKYHNDWE